MPFRPTNPGSQAGRRPPAFARWLPCGLLLALIALLTGCLGPKPVIIGQPRTEPPATQQDPYRVDVLVRNTGPGDGQIEVSVRLVDKRDQTTILYDAHDVQIAKDEQQHVNFELTLPPNAPPANQIDVQVETQYPVE